MDIKEVDVELEKYIDGKVEQGIIDGTHNGYSYKLTNIKCVIEELTKAKKLIEEEHVKALKLWEEATDVYFEYMKSHRGGGRMAKDPPKKPEMSASYDKIDGYISLFTVLVNEESIFTLDFLEKIFLEVARGVEEAKHTTAFMAYCASGCSYATSNYTLTSGDMEDATWSK
jgi:hypothetical protein